MRRIPAVETSPWQAVDTWPCGSLDWHPGEPEHPVRIPANGVLPDVRPHREKPSCPRFKVLAIAGLFAIPLGTSPSRLSIVTVGYAEVCLAVHLTHTLSFASLTLLLRAMLFIATRPLTGQQNTSAHSAAPRSSIRTIPAIRGWPCCTWGPFCRPQTLLQGLMSSVITSWLGLTLSALSEGSLRRSTVGLNEPSPTVLPPSSEFYRSGWLNSGVTR